VSEKCALILYYQILVEFLRCIETFELMDIVNCLWNNLSMAGQGILNNSIIFLYWFSGIDCMNARLLNWNKKTEVLFVENWYCIWSMLDASLLRSISTY